MNKSLNLFISGASYVFQITVFLYGRGMSVSRVFRPSGINTQYRMKTLVRYPCNSLSLSSKKKSYKLYLAPKLSMVFSVPSSRDGLGHLCCSPTVSLFFPQVLSLLVPMHTVPSDRSLGSCQPLTKCLTTSPQSLNVLNFFVLRCVLRKQLNALPSSNCPKPC